MPRSLKAVVLLYLLAGLIGLVVTGYYAIRGEVTISPLVAGLPIGIGLGRLREGWRVCAVAAAAIVLVGTACYLVMLVSGGAEAFLDDRPAYFFAGQCALVGLDILALWVIYTLHSPMMRHYFPGSFLQRAAGAIPCLLLLVGLLCAARLTGGIEGAVAWYDGRPSVGSSIPQPSLAHVIRGARTDQEAVFPLTIEVRGEGGTSYWSLAWRHRHKQFPSTVQHTETSTLRLRSPDRMPGHFADAEDRIVVDIEEMRVAGRDWTPFLKQVEASASVKVRGTGRYALMSIYIRIDVERYRVIGLCTTAHMREQFRLFVENRAISSIVARFADPRRGGTLSSFERLWRARPLTQPELIAMVSASRRLGDKHFASGDYLDAAEAYRQGILAAETFLSQMRYEQSHLERRAHRDAWVPRAAQPATKEELASLHDHIAWKLSTDPRPEARNGAEAVAHATKACELSNGKAADHLGTLAASFAEAGDFEQAVYWQQFALGQGQKGKEGGLRLALFQAGVALRELPPKVDFKQLDKESRDVEKLSPSNNAEISEVILLSAYQQMKQSPDRDTTSNRGYFVKSIERLTHFYAVRGKPEEAAKWRRIAEFYRAEEGADS